MNILVTGANGQLGTEIRNISIGSKHNYIFSGVIQLPGVSTVMLDITNINQVAHIIKNHKIDYVINCAAYTNVEMAEEDETLAMQLNAIAPHNIAKICKANETTLIHISTDYIFGGNINTPIKEDCPANPLNIYGKTKLLGEQLIQESGAKYLILRTSWLYSAYGKNFVKSMLNLTKEKEALQVVYDQVGTPTYAADLARLIYTIIEEDKFIQSDVFNFSNEGVASWYDFAVEINSLANNKCNIIPCLSKDYITKSRRPFYSVLDKQKVKSTFNFAIPYWKDSLKQCIEILKNK